MNVGLFVFGLDKDALLPIGIDSAIHLYETASKSLSKPMPCSSAFSLTLTFLFAPAFAVGLLFPVIGCMTYTASLDAESNWPSSTIKLNLYSPATFGVKTGFGILLLESIAVLPAGFDVITQENVSSSLSGSKPFPNSIVSESTLVVLS